MGVKVSFNNKEYDLKYNQQSGFSLIPLRVFISEKGLAKVVVAIAKGKKEYDKRQSIKEKEDKRMLARLMKK